MNDDATKWPLWIRELILEPKRLPLVATLLRFFAAVIVSIAALVVLRIPLAKLVARLADSSVASWSQLLGPIAWPLAAAIAFLALRAPLAQFLAGLGSRVTKLSLFQVELELSQAKAQPLVSVSLEQIRQPNVSVLLSDSAASIFQQLAIPGSADYAVVDLGNGEEWLTSAQVDRSSYKESGGSIRAHVW
jgi:hypothetical protein